ncbi:MAG: cyclic nucleotide-binding domain-containing protein [Candidatus Marinimicrobia bacterium]|nr:cyclic nucleotide-binding domain-containing protein [Candidatus Neomarinimicrobiota bacterium]
MKSPLWSNLFHNWNSQESEKVLALKEVPVFASLSDKELDEIEKLTHERKYQSGEDVFKQFAPAEGMFIIISGSVEIYIENDGSKNILAELSDRDFFGEIALLDDKPRSAGAIATTPSILLGFFKPDLLSLMERNPSLSSKILTNLGTVLAERLRKTNELLAEKT